MDLTYITERIITIYSPPGCPEEIYLQNLWEIIPMLQSKHGQNYMVRQVDEIKIAREILFLKVIEKQTKLIQRFERQWPAFIKNLI